MRVRVKVKVKVRGRKEGYKKGGRSIKGFKRILRGSEGDI